MNDKAVGRRDFLRSGVALAGGSWLRYTVPALGTLAQAACSARDEAAAFEILEPGEAREFEAIAARILPETASPGAREAGVIWFFDKSFGSFNASSLETARSGLVEFLAGIDDGVPFSELDEEAQDAYLGTQDETSFFGLMRYMTICGFFGMSHHGGNRDDIGWKLIGVNPGMRAYESPFGYYDAEYLRDRDDA